MPDLKKILAFQSLQHIKLNDSKIINSNNQVNYYSYLSFEKEKKTRKQVIFVGKKIAKKIQYQFFQPLKLIQIRCLMRNIFIKEKK